ncbi:MAG: MOSC domain-containing protein [Betaproteobacteria bacterium]|nr:MOSC domain-containing protein [Betaproteobacteria bacterium]
MARAMEGLVHSINVSDGGVPKLPRKTAAVRKGGVAGDRQRDRENHGGPERAVSIYSLELIRALQAEGHPIAAGTIGENLTLAQVSWADMVPGAGLEVGEVVLQLTRHAAPCQNIAGSFSDGRVVRVSEKVHPGWSRFYARVLKEGTLRVGDRVRVIP